MHMAVSSQCRRISCSPLEDKNLHTLWAAVLTVGPFFFLDLRRYRLLQFGLVAGSQCSSALPSTKRQLSNQVVV